MFVGVFVGELKLEKRTELKMRKGFRKRDFLP